MFTNKIDNKSIQSNDKTGWGEYPGKLKQPLISVKRRLENTNRTQLGRIPEESPKEILSLPNIKTESYGNIINKPIKKIQDYSLWERSPKLSRSTVSSIRKSFKGQVPRKLPHLVPLPGLLKNSNHKWTTSFLKK